MLTPKRVTNLVKLTLCTDEELIKHGWEEDVWFHVDNLSSAHIYVRLPEGESWDKISEPLLTDCAQLTKANSIEGKLCSSENVNVTFDMVKGIRKTTSQSSIHHGQT